MKGYKGESFALYLIVTFASALAFSILYALYGLPIEAVVYGWVLLISFLVVTIGLSFFRSRVKLAELKRCLDGSRASNYQVLPEASLEEAHLFREHLANLGQEILRRENEVDQLMAERQDSVTLWVHQIKTPIAAMRLLLSARDENLSLDLLAVELYKIEQYVELALHLDRLDAPTNDLLLKAVDLKQIITGTIKKMRMLFIGKGIGIQLNLPETLPDDFPRVIGDEKWLGVALEQILSNAIKYTAKGTVSIGLSGPVERDQLPDTIKHWRQGVAVLIEDTGIGISEEDLPRVFEKGYTGYHGRYDKRATGIGLYLTKRALALIGASITIESKVNWGTKVVLWLPVE